MLGRDVNSSPLQYRTWVTSNAPDLDGYYYTGLKSGTDPLVDITVYQYPDGYVVDFNLPQPQSWKTTWEVLPNTVYNSQLAIIDGYAYLFGSQGSDVIYRADINNPATWEDTGAHLPTTLCGSQLAVVDGYMYLIGGLGGGTEEALDTIYRAYVTDPLTWTNMGSRLPRVLHKSQLGIADGCLYLFGGQDGNQAVNVIFQAYTTDPLTWIDTGATLPDKIYGSQTAIIDGYFYLFGGLFQEDTPTNNIYKSSLSTPTSFSMVGVLPYSCCYGQFFEIADKGYLIAAAAVTVTQPYLTRIFSCNLSDPSNWVDTLSTLPGDVSQSQLGIIYDRLFLFGGNGSPMIHACNQTLAYKVAAGSTESIYGNVTRTQYQATALPLDLIKVIGIPYWKTSYQM